MNRDHPDDLNTGIAAALDLFDPPDSVDENLLAKVLREVATRADLGDAMFLRSLADAFDHDKAELRATIGHRTRGKPKDRHKMSRVIHIGSLIREQTRHGTKKEAAVAEVMSRYGLSRSTILRMCSEYNKFAAIFDDFQPAVVPGEGA